MAFEPLETDEKQPQPIKQGPDMDTQMIGGCSGFVGAAFITYALCIWPFFLFHQQAHLLGTVVLASALGLIPASIFGALVGAKWGLPSACGFFGGALTTSVFLYLSLQQVAMGHTVKDLPSPDYPASFSWLLPIAWALFALLICVFFAKIGEQRRNLRDKSHR